MAEVAQQRVTEIRPFRVDIPESELTDLRRRINARRKCETTLNSLPNFITEIDGLDIHFIHVRWKLIHYNRLPKGGHFAAWEQPQFLTDEIRVSFRSFR